MKIRESLLALAAVLFSVKFKVYSGMSARRFASDMRDALAKRYVSKAPSFNSFFDYLQMESLTTYLKYLIIESALPLKSVESSFAWTLFVPVHVGGPTDVFGDLHQSVAASGAGKDHH